MENYCNELHKAYQMTFGDFEDNYKNVNVDLMKKIDNYSRACALYLWFNAHVEDSVCLEAVGEIYSSLGGKVEYTLSDILNVKYQLIIKDYEIAIPSFFNDFIVFDKENNTNFSRKIAACFQIMDILYAMIDKKVQDEEAHIITSLQSKLLNECDKQGILPYENEVNPYNFVMDGKELVFKVKSKNGIRIGIKNIENNNNEKIDKSHIKYTGGIDVHVMNLVYENGFIDRKLNDLSFRDIDQEFLIVKSSETFGTDKSNNLYYSYIKPYQGLFFKKIGETDEFENKIYVDEGMAYSSDITYSQIKDETVSKIKEDWDLISNQLIVNIPFDFYESMGENEELMETRGIRWIDDYRKKDNPDYVLIDYNGVQTEFKLIKCLDNKLLLENASDERILIDEDCKMSVVD